MTMTKRAGAVTGNTGSTSTASQLTPLLCPKAERGSLPSEASMDTWSSSGVALPIHNAGQLTHGLSVCSEMMPSHTARHAIPSYGKTPHQLASSAALAPQQTQQTLNGRKNFCQYPKFSFSKINWEQNIYCVSQMCMSPVHWMCLKEPLDTPHHSFTLPSCSSVNSMRLSLLYKCKFDILLCYRGRLCWTNPNRDFYDLPCTAAISLLPLEWLKANKISGAIYGCWCC